MSDKLFLFIVGLVAGCTLTGLAVALHKHDEIVMPAKAPAEGEPKSGDVRQMVEGKPTWATVESPAIEAEKAHIVERQKVTKEIALACFSLGYTAGSSGLDKEILRREVDTLIDRRFKEARK